MENTANKLERKSQSQIDLKQQKCEIADSCSELNTSRQSSAWNLNSCVSNCCTGSSNPFRSKKFQSTTDISRSQEPWHRPLTNCMFDSHFKNINRTEEFQIDHLVAKGAFASVFKVFPKDKPREHEFALKSIKKSKVIRNNCVKQIKEESDIQKLCGHHPFIVQHFDSWQDRRHLYILCEYVSNGELFSKISNFTTELIRLYVAEIAIAIDFLHNAGVIYRDAKPENILLTHNFHIKITDFGLSKWLKLGAKTRTMCGTHQYMAPEILRNEPYGHSVDWWALGVIICQMYTNKFPNIEEIVKPSALNDENDILSKPIVFPEEFDSVDPDGRDVIRRLLDINPKTRLHSVMSLQRIALYKKFKIDKKFIQNITPMDIIKKENIVLRDSTEELTFDFQF
ncbi:serine/threonine-protein kinase S6KL [Episyrphus balteatus]|uniref:serine/threonine-protein kinase S6KL n=1 Tax=Episyrphus balteatus TaxID=286459 RepID=UPI0024866AD8|nr:serine/threonine-protein kinase S6KL [Episyrphus balteatus]